MGDPAQLQERTGLSSERMKKRQAQPETQKTEIGWSEPLAAENTAPWGVFIVSSLTERRSCCIQLNKTGLLHTDKLGGWAYGTQLDQGAGLSSSLQEQSL